MRVLNAYSPVALLFGLSSKTKSVFFRQLATMVDAGLPVGRAVKTSSENLMPAIGLNLADQIDKGSTLSKAMSSFPNHFSAHEIALIHAGEKSGQLDNQLKELASSAELDWELQQRIKGKAVYPILVLHSAIFFPPLFVLVKDGINAYLREVLSLLVPAYLIVIFLFLGFRFFNQYGGPRRLLDHFLSSIPISSPVLRLGSRIRFLHTLSCLSEAGFLPSQAIPLAAEACNNFWLRDRVLAAWKRLGKEVPVSEVMRASDSFQAFELGLVRSGEEAGNFAAMLRKSSDHLRPEYDAHIHRLSVILPVLSLLVIGAFVAYRAASTIGSLYAPLTGVI